MRRMFAALALIATAARADDTPAPPPPPPAEVTLFNFGASNPSCLAWTNACQICVRQSNGDTACSTPGIACTPAEPVCAVAKTP